MLVINITHLINLKKTDQKKDTLKFTITSLACTAADALSAFSGADP